MYNSFNVMNFGVDVLVRSEGEGGIYFLLSVDSCTKSSSASFSILFWMRWKIVTF